MRINKDTKVYGSFAKEAGNTGCKSFNSAFYYYQMNAIYKSFSVDSIEDAVNAAKALDFKGFAITMPYKKEVLKYVDDLSFEVEKIGAANTILNSGGKLTAYNTDYYAAKTLLSKNSDNFDKTLYILGNGGYAAAVKEAASSIGYHCEVITRNNWHKIEEIKNSIVYNCTPVPNIVCDRSNVFIDCLTTTETGRFLAATQASHQFKIYTGQEWPFQNEAKK